MMWDSKYEYYNDYGCGYYYTFINLNIEFINWEFEEFVINRNKGDRDAGELGDIAQHEVLRLAAEFVERAWRFNY